MAKKPESLSDSAPIRVLHLIDELGWGGSQRWIWDIVRLSSPERFSHRVVAIMPDKGEYVYAERLQGVGVYSSYRQSPLLSFLRRAMNRKPVRTLSAPIRKFLALAWHIGIQVPALKRIHSVVREFRPHVIHAHMFCGLTSAMLTKAYFNVPIMHSVPCLFSQMNDAGFSWMPKLYAWHHSHVDSFFTGASLEELRSVGVPPTKIYEIPGVVDCEAIQTASAERERHYRTIRRSLGLSDEVAIVLSVGRLHTSKGHIYALEALPLLVQCISNVHWVVLGEGDQRTALIARAKELGVDRRVHLVGFHSNPLPYYAAADVYLRTNVFEAENLCSYQAMAMGLPVIGFDTGCETELLRKVGHGVLVRNRNSQELASATIGTLLLSDKGRKLGDLGAEYCRMHLDIRQSIDAFCSTYTTLAQGVEVAQ